MEDILGRDFIQGDKVSVYHLYCLLLTLEEHVHTILYV